MTKYAFTIIEILIVIVVLSVLATLTFPVYKDFVEESKATVCQTNLRALETALDIYAMEHDVMPGDLSQIPGSCIERAYSRILQEKGAWKIKLAYLILDSEQVSLVYAAGPSCISPFLKDTLARGDIKLVTCPLDRTPPGTGGRSYAINSIVGSDVDGDGIAGTSRDYQAIPQDTVLVGDCENKHFGSANQLTARHKLQREDRALGAYKNKQIWEFKSGTKKRERKFDSN